MFREIAYFYIIGRPLIFYLGILTFASFLFTAAIAVLNVKFGINKIPFKWHPRMAVISIILAIAHGTIAILSSLSI